MRLILTALIFVGGLFYLLLGLGFLFLPEGTGASFGLTAEGAQGLATMRADLTAFFIIAAVCMLFGAWRRNGDILLVSAGLFLVALIGRFVGLVADGAWPGFWEPMLVEALTVIVLIVASRVLPHRVT